MLSTAQFNFCGGCHGGPQNRPLPSAAQKNPTSPNRQNNPCNAKSPRLSSIFTWLNLAPPALFFNSAPSWLAATDLAAAHSSRNSCSFSVASASGYLCKLPNPRRRWFEWRRMILISLNVVGKAGWQGNGQQEYVMQMLEPEDRTFGSDIKKLGDKNPP